MDKEEMRKTFEAEMSQRHSEWSFTPDPVFGYHNERTRYAWEGWQTAMAHSCGALGDELHRDIMNLPRKYPPDFENEFEQHCYAVGHRDARHAAAELALTALSRHGG